MKKVKYIYTVTFLVLIAFAAFGTARNGRYSPDPLHDELDGFVANEHIDWTDATDALLTTNSGRFDGGIGVGVDPTPGYLLRFSGADSPLESLWLNQEYTGDIQINFALLDDGKFCLGIDNDDSNDFKIGIGDDLHNDTVLSIDSSGDFDFQSGTLAGGAYNGLTLFGSAGAGARITANAAAHSFTNVGINTFEDNTDGFLLTGGDANQRVLIVTGGDWTIDQDVSNGAAPAFGADNFSDGGSNAIVTTTQETNFEAAYTHVSNNGSDHSFIDQSVVVAGTPQFAALGVGAAASADYALQVSVNSATKYIACISGAIHTGSALDTYGGYFVAKNYSTNTNARAFGGRFQAEEYHYNPDVGNGKIYAIYGGDFRALDRNTTYDATGTGQYIFRAGYFYVLDATGDWTTNNPPITTYNIFVPNAPTGYGSNHTHYALYTSTGLVRFGDNVEISGTLDVTGNIDPTSYETTNGGFKDEDDMAADSNTAVASQQSIKAYVDGYTHVATGTYEGDGTLSQAITGVGFLPKYLRIENRVTTGGDPITSFITYTTMVDDTANGGCIELSATTYVFRENAILSLDADGFTVDDNGAPDDHPNKNNQIYNYVCMR